MAQGLITTAMTKARKTPSLGANVFSADSTGYDAALRTIDPAKGTVAGQLKGLMDQENPLMTKARTNTAQAFNARGLINSSMAVGAGEEAAINTALPIASADAGIYDTASRENQAATNTGYQFTAGAQNNAALSDAAAANTSSQIGQTAAETRATQEAGGLIQSRQIAEAGGQTRLTAAQEQAAQSRLAELNAQLQTGLIGAQGTQTRMTQAQAEAAQTELAQLQATLQTGLIGAQGEQARQTQAAGGAIESNLFTRQAEQQTAMQALQGQQGITIQDMQTAAAKDLANIEAEFKVIMQTSATAGQIMSTAQTGINEVLANATLTNDAKIALVKKIQDGLKAQMGVAGAIGGLDLSSLLTFE